MKKQSGLFVAFKLVTLIIFFNSCHLGNSSGDAQIDSDSASIARGRVVFDQNCSGCHNFKQDGIGPQLAGLTEAVSPEWIQNFIHDPKQVIESGDERSKKLFEKYHTIMPSFTGFDKESLGDIVAYLHTNKSNGKKEPEDDKDALKDPIPEKIQASGLVVDLQEVTRIPASSDKPPLTRLIKLGFQPGSEKLLLLDLRGKLYEIRNGEPVVYMDMQSLKKDFIPQPGLATGFGSFAFHPEFSKNGLLYTTHTEGGKTAKADFGYADSIPVALQWVVSEWKTSEPGAFPFKGVSRELFRINMVTGIHGMQEITFNPLAKPGDKDYGLLFIGIGDGGCVENKFPSLVHGMEKPWGTIFRIDPKGNNSANGKYGVPATNPFYNNGIGQSIKEVYAYGFRNPHKITWSKKGQMIACNIGQANSEALYLILPGKNYGWPVREGSFAMNPLGNITKVFALPANDNKDGNISYPVVEYDHDEGKAISGGYEYWGAAIPALKGKFIFGDINNGRLFYVEMKDLKQGSKATIKEWQVALNGKQMPMSALCGSDKVDLRFGRDTHGELYVFTKPDGKLYKLTAAKISSL